MGLFSALFGKKNNTGNNQYSREMEYSKPREKHEEFLYFWQLLQENFPDYDIERSVPIEQIDPYIYDKALPVSFLLRKNGNVKLAILLMDPHREFKHKYVRITEKACTDHSIPFIRFFLTWRNDENYVINRVRRHLR